jgi:inorganic pyrophosphatase
MNDTAYPAPTAFIGQTVTAVIDRPAHSQHPNGTMVYPINYGYLPGIPAPDGDELDVYVLNITQPLARFTGLCIAVIHRLNDNDDKLVLVPPGQTATDEQIKAQTWFQEQYFESVILRSK